MHTHRLEQNLRDGLNGNSASNARAAGASRPLLATLVTTASLWLGGPPDAEAAPIQIMPLGDSLTEGLEFNTNNTGGYRRPLWHLLHDHGVEVRFVGTEFDSSNTHLPDHGWYSYHQGHAGFTAANFAQPADFAPTLVHQLLDDTLETPSHLGGGVPEKILLHIGINDLTGTIGDFEPDKAAENLAAMLDGIKGFYTFHDFPSAEIYVATIIGLPDEFGFETPTQADVLEYNDYVRALVQERQLEGENLRLVEMHGALDYSAGTTDFVPIGGGLLGLHPTTQGYEKMAQVWYDALVPEPSMASLGAVLAGLLLLRRRQRA